MAANKTLYLSQPEDARVFDDASILTDKRVSPLVVTLLRDWVEKTDPGGKRRAAIRKNRVQIGGTNG